MIRLAAESADWLRKRWGRRASAVRLAYKRAFSDAGLVLDDLARLYHAGTTTFVEGDAVTTAFYEGQRSVLLHIASMLNLKEGDLLALPHREGEGSDD